MSKLLTSLRPKQVGKDLLCRLLEWQVRRLRARHDFKVIAVAGSVGKTSTKLAIAHALEVSRRVIYQSGNYNDRLTVPLVLFGRNLPNLYNLPAWARILLANERTIRLPYFYDIAVLELGTDGPGQMRRFAYLQPELAVVTAITPEHMEYFKTLDAVASEELSVCAFSKQVLVNFDDISPRYLAGKTVTTFGLGEEATYRASGYQPAGLAGGTLDLRLADEPPISAEAQILGEQGVKILLAAAATAHLLGLSRDQIAAGLKEVKSFAGRMQVLPGIEGSTIIDDTYNASPTAVMAALDVLYATEAPQRIAILGNMNELGDYSQKAHQEVGAYCQPSRLDLVVTIGPDAEKFLAPAARATGCQVETFASPYEAGEYVKQHLKPGAVVLAEGSQNGVFAEESLKSLLADPGDAKKLVRQSADWMKIKSGQFGTPPA